MYSIILPRMSCALHYSKVHAGVGPRPHPSDFTAQQGPGRRGLLPIGNKTQPICRSAAALPRRAAPL
jgi:hypothetical protein